MFKKIAFWPVLAGACFGVLAPILVKFGNPGNMGVCAACFLRDTSGALSFHSVATLQYIRPEIIGLIIGAFLSSILLCEFRPRSGSSPVARFFLGMFAMIGALVFLGCPWRMWLRLSGGDLSAIAGIFGIVVGILIGVFFLKRGFSLGRSKNTSKIVGFLFPVFALVLLALLLCGLFGDSALAKFSQSGPGSQHAPFIFSLIVGLFLGFLFQKSRFCTIVSVRDTFLFKETYALQGIIALVVCAFVTNIILGQFHLGFPGEVSQPLAHNDTLWNFLGMLLAGFALTLAGGCPGRQIILSGEGDGDAGVFVLGALIGAGVAHNFALASSPSGIGANAPVVVFTGLIFCIFLGFFAKERR